MMDADLALAFMLVDLADAETISRWSPGGVASTSKGDGTPVTAADIAAEQTMLDALRNARPADGFVGEEVGEVTGTAGRRWIADGIDGTRFYAAGLTTWGTLLALEENGRVVLGVSSSPAQNRRWWASLGNGAFTAASDHSGARRVHVSTERYARSGGVVSLPGHDSLTPSQRVLLEGLAGERPAERAWSHQNRVAEGEVDICVWFAGDIWDHAAPSIIVEEAGGRFSDHRGGKRLDTRTAIYSNGARHDEVLEALKHPAQ